MENESEKLARIFQVLSAEKRIQIIKLLKNQSLCVCVISERLNLTHAATSQHLRILKDIGILISERKGYFIHYRINESLLSEWQKITHNLFRI